MIHAEGKDNTLMLDGTKDMDTMIDEVFSVVKGKIDRV